MSSEPDSFPKASRQGIINARLTKIVRHLKKLPKLGPTGMMVLREVEEVLSLLNEELPGMPEKPPPSKYRRPTLAEILAYCQERHWPAQDGQWFFDKMLGCGWKNDGKAVVDWEATMRSWRRIKVFPSQRQEPPTSFGKPGRTVVNHSDVELNKLLERTLNDEDGGSEV